MEERLKKFACLVDAGSFTKAAVELHVSQPALSSSIAKLERELKTHLLVRGVRPLSLTPAGKLAYQTAKSLSVQADNLRQSLAELAHERVSLNIGMIDSMANVLFADGEGLGPMENSRVSVVVNNSRYLTPSVERGDLDIAFIAEQQGRPPASLEARPVAAEQLVVVSSSARADKDDRTLNDFVAYDQASNTFRLVSEALRSYGVTPITNFYSTSPEIILRLVLQNKGVAALPYLMVRDYLHSGSLKRLGGKTPWLIPRKIVALKRRDKELPLALVQLINQTSTILEELTDEALVDVKSPSKNKKS